MGRRGQPEHQQTSLRVAETWHGPSPVLFITVSRTFDAADPFTPLNQPRTPAALNNLTLDLIKPRNLIMQGARTRIG